MTINKKGGYSGGRPASEMSPPAKVTSETIKPFREHTTTKDCWRQPEVEVVPGPESPDSPYLEAMRRVEARRALIADVDLPAEYAKAAASVTRDLLADLEYAQADARHWHQGWEAATRDVERQRQWLSEATERLEAVKEQRDSALLRERAAKEDAATHAEREGFQAGVARRWESLRQTIVDLSAMALFHAQHDGVDPKDRQRILDLVVRVSEGMPKGEGDRICFCGRPLSEHPPGPPCPPPPPPGFAHG